MILFETLYCFQLTIGVSDGRGNYAEAFVLIHIIRNPDDIKPEWVQLDSDENYHAVIVFNLEVNATVSRRVKAFDRDIQVYFQIISMIVH